MDERSLNALEYPKIKEMLAQFCVNDPTKSQAVDLLPSTSQAFIERQLETLDEALGLTIRRGRLPMAKNEDITPLLARAGIGSTLEIREMRHIASVLRTVRDLLAYKKEDEEETPNLDDAFDGLDACQDLIDDIEEKFISDTEVADSASRELMRIRREMTSIGRRITDKLNSILSSAENERYLQDKLITIRGGRYVVPVKTEYRSRFPGLVMDRSSSGQTLYIEPAAIVELNNDLRLLEAEEREEIERILSELTERIALYRPVLQVDYDTLIELDYIFAKAAFALSINAVRPTFSPHHKLELKKARHPLIPKEQVVASDIVLDEDILTLVVTGPNTGGKTVTLKTLGLLSLMAQSGLFIPAGSGSFLPLFENVFADIGDEQSIEQSLSTFSSHMTNIVEILKQADENALVLFDELGAGTDPQEGAALAISILEELRKRGVLTAATTHYAELKEYGLTTPGVVNASVEFDVESLRPTYRLLIGIPGKSNAFEIARRLGLPNSIIEDSGRRISEEQKEFDAVLAQAEKKAFEADRALERAAQREREALRKLEEAGREKNKNNEKAEKILFDAQNKAADLIAKTKEETTKIYREVQTIQREAEASVDNKTLERLRKRLNDADKEAQKAEDRRKKKAQRWDTSGKKLTLKDFKPGDRVYIKSIDREADVLEILEKDKKVMIQSGNMKMSMKPADLVKMAPAKEKTPKAASFKGTAKVAKQLDLRGRTVDEAVMMTEQFLSDAIMGGLKNVRIIHGMGTGKVRAAVQDVLKRSSLVSSYRYGKPDEGGTGATVVKL